MGEEMREEVEVCVWWRRGRSEHQKVLVWATDASLHSTTRLLQSEAQKILELSIIDACLGNHTPHPHHAAPSVSVGYVPRWRVPSFLSYSRSTFHNFSFTLLPCRPLHICQASRTWLKKKVTWACLVCRHLESSCLPPSQQTELPSCWWNAIYQKWKLIEIHCLNVSLK